MLTVPSLDLVEAETCRRSLREYTAAVWPLIEPGRPFVPNWHIDAIIEHLEAVTNGEIRKLLINVQPRAMKSLLVSVLWPTWEWLDDPRVRWLFASYAQTLATRDARKSRALMQTQGLRGLTDREMSERTVFERLGYKGVQSLLAAQRGEDGWEFAGDQNLKMRYENDRTGYRISSSFGGSVTGEGGDRRVIDDPHKPDEMASDTVRESDVDWYDQVWSSRGMNPATDTEVLIMQRLHEGDLTGHVLEHGGWEHLCLPAEYEPTHPFLWPDDPRTETGELLWPERVTRDYLDAKRTELGSYGYAGQYQQLPSPAEGGILKAEWWQRYPAYRWPPPKELCASWDFAFKDTDGTDYVVGQVWLRDLADKYLLCQIRARLEFTATVDAVLALQQWVHDHTEVRAHRIYVEDKANGPAVISALRRRVPGLVPVQPQGSKEARARAASPQIEAGNVHLPKDVIPAPDGYDPSPVDAFIHECTAFPNGLNDDQVDAMSQALIQMDRRAGARKVRAGGYRKGHDRDR